MYGCATTNSFHHHHYRAFKQGPQTRVHKSSQLHDSDCDIALNVRFLYYSCSPTFYIRKRNFRLQSLHACL